jgi:hypothetical protein
MDGWVDTDLPTDLPPWLSVCRGHRSRSCQPLHKHTLYTHTHTTYIHTYMSTHSSAGCPPHPPFALTSHHPLSSLPHPPPTELPPNQLHQPTNPPNGPTNQSGVHPREPRGRSAPQARHRPGLLGALLHLPAGREGGGDKQKSRQTEARERERESVCVCVKGGGWVGGWVGVVAFALSRFPSLRERDCVRERGRGMDASDGPSLEE